MEIGGGVRGVVEDAVRCWWGSLVLLVRVLSFRAVLREEDAMDGLDFVVARSME